MPRGGVYHPNHTLNDEFYISGESYTGLSSYSWIDTQLTVLKFSALIIAQCIIIKNNYNIMLICHKRVASNEAAILQACHVSDVHHACNKLLQITMQPHRMCLSCQHRERLCTAESFIQSYLPLLVSQTPSLGSGALPPPALVTQLSYPWNCMHASKE